jgi:hypothetical protein
MNPGSPPTVIQREDHAAVALRIDSFPYDAATGSAVVTGRISAGQCLLSSDLDGQVFFGDELSMVKSPLVSVEAAGTNATGQFVAIRLNGERTADSITGTLNFDAADNSAGPPCTLANLKFTLMRVGN